jgi:peptidyl-prolyl cis-trans isomerase SurA
MIARRLGLLWLLAVAAAGLPGGRAAAEGVDRIVAVVNGEAITQSDLREAIAKRHANLGAVPSDAGTAGDEQHALNELIERRIQLQIALRKGITIAPEEVDRAQRDIQARSGIRTEEALRAELVRYGLTLDQYREDLRQQLLTLKLANREVRSGIILNDQEMMAYYRAHQPDYRLPDEYDLSQILLPVPRPEDAPAIRAQAAELVRRLRAGEPFETVARLATPAQSGELGRLKKGHMLSYIEQAVAALKAGEVSEPIQTAAGVHIFRLNALQTGQVRPYEEVKAEIREALCVERSRQIYDRWLQELRDRALVEIKH